MDLVTLLKVFEGGTDDNFTSSQLSNYEIVISSLIFLTIHIINFTRFNGTQNTHYRIFIMSLLFF